MEKRQRTLVSYDSSHTWASTRLPGGGEILKISKGGGLFFENFLEGDRFFALEGGDIPYKS